jgi:hypothetical protein
MRYLILICLSFITIKSKAQVITLHDKLAERIHDTTITLQYFKNADSVLINKLDSFDLYLKNIKYKLDPNYFYTIDLGVPSRYGCRKEIAIHYRSQYCDYITVANLGKNKSPYRYRTVFSFFLYKNKLVLCNILRRDLHLTDDASKLLTNLIYEHVDESEKKLILGYPQDSYKVLTKPVKGYFLDY